MSANISEAPTTVHRRRRTVRREKTPDPNAKGDAPKWKYSDEESSSTTGAPETTPKLPARTSNSAHRFKILNRRDKACGPTHVKRSQSTGRALERSPEPRVEEVKITTGDVMTFLKQAKRSLSLPRYVSLSPSHFLFLFSANHSRILFV